MRAQSFLFGAAVATATAIAVVACGGSGDGGTASGFTVTKIVADTSTTKSYTGEGDAPATVDAALVNPWGIVFNPSGFVWVANNHSNTSTVYDGNGVKQLEVALPDGTDPTGIVYNGSADFSGALFIFDGEGGMLASWGPSNGTSAVSRFTASDGAVYKGLAIANNGSGNFLYATDFHNGKVDVFGSTFAKQSASSFPFTDPSPPQTGFAPFGIQAITSGTTTQIYVAYAKTTTGSDDETAGAGLGYIDVFTTNGGFVRHLTNAGVLDAPWGMALAPSNFGAFSGDLLVGNFGDGKVHAFDPNGTSVASVGALQTAAGADIVLEGLWGIAFGNGINSQPTNALFFAAGPNDELNGIYGKISCNGC
jgi:uncharacterized protein (TIGR03118 family)